MGNNNSKSSSKSIEQLLKELSDLHKQFDSINIEKTMSLNNSKSIVKKGSDKVKSEDKTSKIKAVKSKPNIDTLASKPEKIKPSDLVVENDDLIENIEKQVNEIRTVQLEINKQTPESEVNTSETPTIDITNNNNDNLNESYLSIKDKLEKIKSEIKEKEKSYDMDFSNTTIKKEVKINNTKESKLTTTIKEKKLVNKVENIDAKKSNDTKSINKQLLNSDTLNKKKSNMLTIIILTLVIVILLSVYLYFFR